MNILLSFLPWIVFYGLQHVLGLTWALVIAIILLLVTPEVKRLMKGFLVTWMILISMLIMLLISICYPTSLTSFDRVLIMSGSFAVMAWISLIIKKPFTLQYAKERVPKEKWDSPVFFKVNMIITLLWAICMTVSTLSSIFNYQQTLISIIAIVIAIIGTKRIPEYYKKKYAK